MKFFLIKVFLVVFIISLFYYIFDGVNYISKFVQHKTNRDNVEFVIDQVVHYKRHNTNNTPTIYLNGPSPILFYLTHGSYKNSSYYGDYLSKEKLGLILEKNKSIYLVGYNPLFLKYRYKTRGAFLSLKQNDEIIINFEDGMEREAIFNFVFYDNIFSTRKQQISLEDFSRKIPANINGIQLKRNLGKVSIKTGNRSAGFQLCYKDCSLGWMLGKGVELSFNEKTVDLSLKDVKKVYGDFDVVNSSGSLYFAKTRVDN